MWLIINRDRRALNIVNRLEPKQITMAINQPLDVQHKIIERE
jgi:hypothetical protein